MLSSTGLLIELLPLSHHEHLLLMEELEQQGLKEPEKFELLALEELQELVEQAELQEQKVLLEQMVEEVRQGRPKLQEQ